MSGFISFVGVIMKGRKGIDCVQIQSHCWSSQGDEGEYWRGSSDSLQDVEEEANIRLESVTRSSVQQLVIPFLPVLLSVEIALLYISLHQ